MSIEFVFVHHRFLIISIEPNPDLNEKNLVAREGFKKQRRKMISDDDPEVRLEPSKGRKRIGVELRQRTKRRESTPMTQQQLQRFFSIFELIIQIVQELPHHVQCRVTIQINTVLLTRHVFQQKTKDLRTEQSKEKERERERREEGTHFRRTFLRCQMQSCSFGVRFSHLPIDLLAELKKQLEKRKRFLFDKNMKWIMKHAQILSHTAMHLSHSNTMFILHWQRIEINISRIRRIGPIHSNIKRQEIFNQTTMTRRTRKTKSTQTPRSTNKSIDQREREKEREPQFHWIGSVFDQ